MTLEEGTFLVVVLGLVALVCILPPPPNSRIVRVAVIVAAILWAILRINGSIPTR